MGAGGAVPTHNVLGGHEFPLVIWYKDPGLRKLYALLATVILVSATNGFDGSMMNGLQTVDNWQNCLYQIFTSFDIELENSYSFLKNAYIYFPQQISSLLRP